MGYSCRRHRLQRMASGDHRTGMLFNRQRIILVQTEKQDHRPRPDRVSNHRTHLQFPRTMVDQSLRTQSQGIYRFRLGSHLSRRLDLVLFPIARVQGPILL